jgi:hypothetical protein
MKKHKKEAHNLGRGTSQKNEEPTPDVFTDVSNVAKHCNASDSPNQDVRDKYEIIAFNQKFTEILTEKTEFKLTFKVMEQCPIDHVNTVMKTLQNVMHGLVKSMHPNSVCRLVLMNPLLDPAVNFPALPVSELTSELIFSQISEVLQSHQEMDMNQLIGHLILTQPPGEGGARHQLGVNQRQVGSLRKWCQLSRNLLDVPEYNDNLCGLRALMGALQLVRMGKMPKNYMLKNKRLITSKAKKLQLKAPFSPQDLGVMVETDNEFAGCQLNVYGTSVGKKRLYQSERAAPNQLNLLLENKHYYIIKDMALFLGTKQYCHQCDTGFNSEKQHKNCSRARSRCQLCHKVGCCNKDQSNSETKIYCGDCNRSFFTQQCFNYHDQAGICDASYNCEICGKFCYRKNVHQCGVGYCHLCERNMPLGHQFCCMKKLENRLKEQKPVTYIFYSLETSINEPTQKPVACFSQEGTDPTTFQKKFGPKCIDDWLLNYVWPLAKQKKNQRMDKTICVSHNSSGFDGWYILHWFYKQDLKVKVVMHNNRLLQLCYQPLKLYFKDSLAFIPVPLSQFSSTFDLQEEKGWYPHKLTTWENLQKTDPLFPPGKFPPLEAFLPYEQKPNKYLELVDWHRSMCQKFEVEKLTYNLRKQMDKHFERNVKLLAEGASIFMHKFQEMNFGFDPFRDNCTNTSSGLACFRTFYYNQENLPILLIGENSLKPPLNKSRIADAWLAKLEEGLKKSLAREFTVGKYKVDACDTEEKRVYKFNGCICRSCPRCCEYSKEKCLVSGKTADQLRKEQRERKEYINQMGYSFEEIFECQLIEQAKYIPELFRLITNRSQCFHEEDINPREALFGGRTSCFSRYFSCQENQHIAFKNFVSFYPYQMIRKQYPVGEPIVINDNFKHLNQYWGLVKCDVLPPRGEFIGVLPYNANGRLVFPLCATCAKYCQQEPICPHSKRERQLHGVFTTFELEAALEVGYQITHLCQIWHWPEEKRSSKIFAPYLNKMLGEKMKSKALPEKWTEEQKQQFVNNINATYGFELSPGDFNENPGMKLVAKIFLNCFWRSFCLNTSGSKFVTVEGYENIWKKLNDPKVIVKDFAPVSETKMVMAYRDVEKKAMDNPILVGIFTCSYGRVDLLRAMQKVVKEGGKESLLYCDTDFIIHAEKIDAPEILPTGEDLGDLASKVPDGHQIVRFCCADPKVFVLEIQKPDGSIEFRQKFKGFPNMYRSNQSLNGEEFLKQFLKDYENLKINVKLKDRI